MNFELRPQSIAATILVALSAYGVFRYFRKRTSQQGETVNWTPLEAVSITIAIYFIAQLVVAIAVAIIGKWQGISVENLSDQIEASPAKSFAYVLAVEALTIGLLYKFMKRRQTPWKAIGLIKPRLVDVGWAVLGFGIYFVTYGMIVYSIIKSYVPQIDTDQQQQLGFDTSTTGPALIFIFLALVILPPLVEEILVRGFLFTGLKSKMKIIPAAIITSLVFGAAHLQWGSGAALLWSAAVDTFMLSLVLVFLRHKSGSLWPGIGLHFIKNGIAFTALFIFKVV